MNTAEYNARVKSSHRVTLTLEVDIDNDYTDGIGALAQVLQIIHSGFEIHTKVEDRGAWCFAWVNKAEVTSAKTVIIQTIPMANTPVAEEVAD